ncbi:hypothetical protein C8J57DRAFT_1222261 [Mycena rebaudengoi]|nr:hypothetical protein C8J57DRAFT_1222261 [Mycena rebaudengoi]
MVSDSQRALIESIVFSTDIEGQLQASAVMAQYALDVGARDDLSNRWTSQWSEQTGKEGAKIKRVLYLCSCGYDHTKRNTKYDRQQPQDHLVGEYVFVRVVMPCHPKKEGVGVGLTSARENTQEPTGITKISAPSESMYPISKEKRMRGWQDRSGDDFGELKNREYVSRGGCLSFREMVAFLTPKTECF